MQRKKQDGLEWLEFELLQNFPEVKHGVFLHTDLGEKGGVEDQMRVLDLFGIRGIKLKQVHKDAILDVKELDEKLTLYEGFDGMVTQEREVGLLIRHADCQAAILYDPTKQALANVHCGWRGSICNIYLKTIRSMQRLYGTKPSDLHVCIGPSLGPESAEFKHYRKELPQSFWRFQVRPTYFDFWAISKMQLIDAGVPGSQIEIAELCTLSHPETFFSYRREKQIPLHGTIVSIL